MHRSSVEVASRGSLMGVLGVPVGIADMPAGELDIAWGDRPPGREVLHESVELHNPRGCPAALLDARSLDPITLVTAYPPRPV